MSLDRSLVCRGGVWIAVSAERSSGAFRKRVLALQSPLFSLDARSAQSGLGPLSPDESHGHEHVRALHKPIIDVVTLRYSDPLTNTPETSSPLTQSAPVALSHIHAKHPPQANNLPTSSESNVIFAKLALLTVTCLRQPA